MSRRRRMTAREIEPVIKGNEESVPAQQPASTNTDSKQGSFARVAMLLWGFPLILFIVVAVLKPQCG